MRGLIRSARDGGAGRDDPGPGADAPRFVHIITDEKFPDHAYTAFEAVAPGASEYVLPGGSGELRYLKKIDPTRVWKYAFLDPFFQRRLERARAVFLHGLTNFGRELVCRSRHRTTFVWIGMGFDYYDLIYPDPSALLKEQTRALCGDALDDAPPSWLGRAARSIKARLHRYPERKLEAIGRIEYFAPVLEPEYHQLKGLYPDAFNRYVDWHYGASARLLDGDLGHREVTGRNVLVGNSATPTNNHVEAFSLLSEIAPAFDGEVLVPLSYGSGPYREKVIEVGRALLGDRFRPLTEFLTFPEFMDRLASCSAVLMNQKRQQGGGTLTAALYLGARVFIDPSNAFYPEYRDHGVILHSLAELRERPELLTAPLSADERARNRKIVRDLRGWNAVLTKTKRLVESLDAPDRQTD